MHQLGTFSLTPLESLTLTSEQGLLTQIFDTWYDTYFWRGIFKITNKWICVLIKKEKHSKLLILERRKGEWEVRRSGGRSDRGFCKIEGRIDRRRWNRSEQAIKGTFFWDPCSSFLSGHGFRVFLCECVCFEIGVLVCFSVLFLYAFVSWMWFFSNAVGCVFVYSILW